MHNARYMDWINKNKKQDNKFDVLHAQFSYWINVWFIVCQELQSPASCVSNTSTDHFDFSVAKVVEKS